MIEDGVELHLSRLAASSDAINRTLEAVVDPMAHWLLTLFTSAPVLFTEEAMGNSYRPFLILPDN